jgi:hypothetical protein
MSNYYMSPILMRPVKKKVAAAWFEDSFEGTAPNGWKAEWNSTLAGSPRHITTSEAGTPAGGGTYAYRQDYFDEPGNPGELGLYFSNVPGMPATIGNGGSFYVSYYLKYDTNFDWGTTSGFKQIIAQTSDNGSDIRNIFYHVILGSNPVAPGNSVAYFQYTGNPAWPCNVNPDDYYNMPKGEWVKFEWLIGVSTSADANGYLKGWINGTLRYSRTNVITLTTGEYYMVLIAQTFNEDIGGPNQKRYYDKFVIGPGSMAPSS